MFCKSCGKEIANEAVLCPGCGQPAAGASAGTSAAAIWSLVLGILSVLLCCNPLTALPAIICGHVGRGNINRSGGKLGGDGMAITGLILGYLSIVAFVLILALFLLSAAFQESVRSQFEDATEELGGTPSENVDSGQYLRDLGTDGN